MRLVPASRALVLAWVVVSTTIDVNGLGVRSQQATVSLPAPTGPSPVGRRSYRWIDTARRETLGPDRSASRELVVHVWYPAANSAGPPAEYFPDLARLQRVLRGKEGEAWRRVRAHARADAEIATATEPFPVILFSHGNEMAVALYSFLAEELASRGFVVAGIDHPYEARAVLLSTGAVAETVAGPPPTAGMTLSAAVSDSPHARFYRERVEVRAEDASFVLNQLERLNTTTSALTGRLNLTRVGFAGHSVGGVAAGRACQRDARFSACANLDGQSPQGPFYLSDDGSGFDQPYLSMTKPFEPDDRALAMMKIDRDEWTRRKAAADRKHFDAVRGGSYRVTITGATHTSFSDDPMVISSVTKNADLERQSRIAAIVRQYVVAFFNRFVHQRAEPFPMATPHPEVLVESWSSAGQQ